MISFGQSSGNLPPMQTGGRRPGQRSVRCHRLHRPDAAVACARSRSREIDPTQLPYEPSVTTRCSQSGVGDAGVERLGATDEPLVAQEPLGVGSHPSSVAPYRLRPFRLSTPTQTSTSQQLRHPIGGCNVAV